MTWRYVAVGRNSRSLPLLSGGASGCSKKVDKWTIPFEGCTSVQAIAEPAGEAAYEG